MLLRDLKSDCWTQNSSKFLANTDQTPCELTAQDWSGSLSWRNPAHIASRHVWTHTAQVGPCRIGVHMTQASLPCAWAACVVWMALELQRDFPGAHTQSHAFPSLPVCWRGDRGGRLFVCLLQVGSNWSFFCCRLYRASPPLAAKNIISLISVLTIW